jgi:hypothetical protein
VSASTRNQALSALLFLYRVILRVELPDRIAEKYPRSVRESRWQWVFPATRRRFRHHLHESVVQRALRTAADRARAPPTRRVPPDGYSAPRSGVILPHY